MNPSMGKQTSDVEWKTTYIIFKINGELCWGVQILVASTTRQPNQRGSPHTEPSRTDWRGNVIVVPQSIPQLCLAVSSPALLGLHPKWHPIPFTVYYFGPGPIRVLVKRSALGNRVPIRMQIRRDCQIVRKISSKVACYKVYYFWPEPQWHPIPYLVDDCGQK